MKATRSAGARRRNQRFSLRGLHARCHCGPPLCTTGRLQKALFYLYNLDLLHFSGGLAEGENLGSNILRVNRRNGRYTSVPPQEPFPA